MRLEHGRIYQQMGDIQRKLGKLPDSEQAYRKAVEILEPLAGHAGAGPRPLEHSLVPARCLVTCWFAAATKVKPTRSLRRPPPPSRPLLIRKMPRPRIVCVLARP